MNNSLLNEQVSTGISLNCSILDGNKQVSIERSNLDRARDFRHPAIQQLFALGYEEGDKVTGRNIPVGNGRTQDWEGVLGKNNIAITELKFHGKGDYRADGVYHEDGLEWLDEENCDKQIYYNVNGGRKNADVSRIYSIFFEHDTGTHAEQMAQTLAFPIAPSVAVRTRKSTHVYFRVGGEDIEDIEGWVKFQEKIAYTMGSDPAVKDKPRLMRLAGFDHIKEGLPNVPCTLEICDPNAIYSYEEIRAAISSYAQSIGIKPFTQERFAAYQFINNRLNQKKDGRDYSHERFSPNFFRTCDDSEIAEQLLRSKDWVRLYESKFSGKDVDVDPETAWTNPLPEVAKRVKKEYNIDLVPSLSQGGDLLTVKWAKAHTEGFEENGRGEWHTCKCPNHAGHSFDSLHIHTISGALKCHGGCDSSDVEVRLRQLAKDAGDETWNVERYKNQGAIQQTPGEWYESKVNAEVAKHSELTIKPEWEHIICDRYSLEILQKIPANATVLLKAPTGAGKTWALDKIINEIYSESRVLSIVPTVCLSIGDKLRKRGNCQAWCLQWSKIV